MDYSDQVIRLRELIRKKNQKNNNVEVLKKNVRILRFGLIGVMLVTIIPLAYFLNLHSTPDAPYFRNCAMALGGLTILFSIIIIPRAFQLKKLV